MTDYEKGLTDAITALFPLIEWQDGICDDVCPIYSDWCEKNCKGISEKCVRKYIEIIMEEKDEDRTST